MLFVTTIIVALPFHFACLCASDGKILEESPFPPFPYFCVSMSSSSALPLIPCYTSIPISECLLHIHVLLIFSVTSLAKAPWNRRKPYLIFFLSCSFQPNCIHFPLDLMLCGPLSPPRIYFNLAIPKLILFLNFCSSPLMLILLFFSQCKRTSPFSDGL